jgi:NAD(P)-dependent dehydrogenase (short-subunit alcohol dehydrogenase family)
MDLQLSGQRVLVTGASKGIGLATARMLAGEGCDVALNAREAQRLEAAARALGEESSRRAVAVPGDMSVDRDAKAVVDAAVAALGGIDVLVTCAGSSPGGLLTELSEEDWLGSMRLKFLGYVRTVRHVIPHMLAQGSGAIVLVVGNDGLKPSYWELTAGAANAADINFASSIAEQYGPLGIRVNTVNPGPVATDRWDGLEKAFARDMKVTQDRAHELALASLPFGRICRPEEVASVVTFLASPLASYVNGAHIPVDGAQRKPIMDVVAAFGGEVRVDRPAGVRATGSNGQRDEPEGPGR